METSQTTFTVTADTDIRAWVQSTKDFARAKGCGIPVLHVGGDPKRRYRDGSIIALTFYGYTRDELLAAIDRMAVGLAMLRGAIVDPHDMDERVPAKIGEPDAKATAAA